MAKISKNFYQMAEPEKVNGSVTFVTYNSNVVEPEHVLVIWQDGVSKRGYQTKARVTLTLAEAIRLRDSITKQLERAYTEDAK